jgi:hypothetical protein
VIRRANAEAFALAAPEQPIQPPVDRHDPNPGYMPARWDADADRNDWHYSEGLRNTHLERGAHSTGTGDPL